MLNIYVHDHGRAAGSCISKLFSNKTRAARTPPYAVWHHYESSFGQQLNCHAVAATEFRTLFYGSVLLPNGCEVSSQKFAPVCDMSIPALSPGK